MPVRARLVRVLPSRTTVLDLAGAGLVVAGVAMVWVPAALVVAGLAVLAHSRAVAASVVPVSDLQQQRRARRAA